MGKTDCTGKAGVAADGAITVCIQLLLASIVVINDAAESSSC